MDDKSAIPMLFPFDPSEFWVEMRKIVKEEVGKIKPEREVILSNTNTPGFVEKPLYKLNELCKLFNVSKPTIYDWIKHGKLKPYKIQSRVYFLWEDIDKLFNPDQRKSG